MEAGIITIASMTAVIFNYVIKQTKILILRKEWTSLVSSYSVYWNMEVI